MRLVQPMNVLRLHESLVDADAPTTLRDLLETPLPPANAPLRQVAALERMHTALVTALAANTIDCDPYSLHVARERMRRTLVVDARELSRLDEAHLVGGYSRLVLVYIVIAQLNVAVGRRRANTALDAATNAWAARNGVHALPGGVASLAVASMRELRRVVDVLLWRLRVIDSLDDAYLDALEQRTSEFVTNAERSPDDYDVLEWRVGAAELAASSRSFASTAAWWMLTLRRAQSAARTLDSATCYATPTRRALVRRVDAARWPALVRARAAVRASLRELGRRMHGVDRIRTFRALAHDAFAVAPGALALHTRVYGLGGAERATPLEIVARTRPPTAATWLARRRYNRPIAAWVDAALARRSVTGGGVATEAPIERVALLHVVDSLLAGRRFSVPFVDWFVVLEHVVGSAALVEHTLRALTVRLPFIVQSLGNFFVVVPHDEPHKLERAMGLQYADDDDDELAAIVYRCDTVVDALVVWASAMLEGWQGRVEHSNKNLAPFLREFLALDQPSAADVRSDIFAHP